MNTIVIDVSKHQGIINWKSVAGELRKVNDGNPGGVIIRIGYSQSDGGLTIDQQFENNANGCELYGIPYGVYFYSYDHSANAAEVSAKAVVKAIGTRKLAYPVYIDVEYEKFNLSAGKDANTRIIKAACNYLEKAGFFAGVYCSRDFFLNHTNVKDLKMYTLWEAAYTSGDTTAVVNDMWQYSSTNAAGIAGFGNHLDCNKCYRDFPTIIKNAGLNNFGKETNPESTVNWESESNWFRVGCSKGDRPELRQVCERLSLPIYNL